MRQYKANLITIVEIDFPLRKRSFIIRRITSAIITLSRYFDFNTKIIIGQKILANF